ncbi:MAG: hypothetical protein JSR77_08805 [Planctomycetes bacterium]|nr:hypothetical protein [Planctomycetota bacterium]
MIRQAAAERVVRDAVVLDLGDLARQGEACRQRARAEAGAIVQEAKAERERLIRGAAEQGKAEGFAKGREQGIAEGREQGRRDALAERGAALDLLAKGWGESLAGFLAAREAALVEARRDVVQLAVLLAERIVKRAIELEPQRVADQVAAVLATLARPTRLRLRMHPEDEALVRESLPSVAANFNAAEHLEIVTDASMRRGGVIAETAGGGAIDATIRTQLDRMARALLPGHAEPFSEVSATPRASSEAPSQEGAQ